MSKEEFIKLIETLEFEELRCATISYYKKKPSKYGYNDEDYNPKTICVNTNLESLINEYYENVNNKINDIYRELEVRNTKND